MKTSAEGVTVIIPTLAADEAVVRCVEAVEAQRWREFEIFVVDNSGCGRARKLALSAPVRVIENSRNLGFGAAINQAVRASDLPYVATLNDDAFAHPGWLGALVEAMRADAAVGMCASCVRLLPGPGLDSAGMLLCADGSSKQRGHLAPPERYGRREEVFFPSGSAALFRRAMLDEIGLFDEDFFLYCEDTDLGLRARWAGWKCLYVPEAAADHLYSHSAGRASALKAYYVERNRLFVVAKNFPVRAFPAVLPRAAARYYWHLRDLSGGRGRAAEFRGGGPVWKLVWYVLRAHLAVLAHLPALLAKRKGIRRKIGSVDFLALMRRHAISAREVASL